MKSNIAPKVAVILAITTAIFALSVQIATANQMLKNLRGTLPYLWGSCAVLILVAAWLAFFQRDQHAIFEAKVSSKIREIRKLQNEATAANPGLNVVVEIKPQPGEDVEIFNEAMRRIRDEESHNPHPARWQPRY